MYKLLIMIILVFFGSKVFADYGEFNLLYAPLSLYPHKASINKIEGWVLVKFDIDTNGATENVKVLEAEPVSYFEKSAIKTALRREYKPYKSKGEAVSLIGVKVFYDFCLDEEILDADRSRPENCTSHKEREELIKKLIALHK